MQKENVVTVTAELFKILEPLDSDERMKVVSAVLTLLGEKAPNVSGTMQEDSGGEGASENTTPKDFFDSKEPQNKGEELAVAARYRELYSEGHENTKEDLKKIITAARRNFDNNNFRRDLTNAKTKGLFNKGKEHTLSYYGEEYVDALPDRNAVKKIRKPKGTGRKQAKKKKVASTKADSKKSAR